MNFKSIFVTFILLTLSQAVKVADNEPKIVPNNTNVKAYEKVEHIPVDVSIPSSSTTEPNEIKSEVFSESGVIIKAETVSENDTRSNVKPRKGVHYEPPLNDTETTATYKVNEDVKDVENKHPPKLLTANDTILGIDIKYGPSQSFNANMSKTTSSIDITPKAEIQEVKPQLKPKKPSITYSIEDEPSIAKYASEPRKTILTQETNEAHEDLTNPKVSSVHSVEEPEQAMSKELLPEEDPTYGGYFGYIVLSCVVLLFIAIPVIFGRKLKDYWNTRHYRRVDFLVDGMYND